MKSFFNKIRSVLRVFNALKGLINSIKSGISLLSLPLTGWALIAVAAIVIFSVATSYEDLRFALKQMRSQFISENAPAGGGPLAIKTSISKDDPKWIRKYCDEQAGKLPPPPFKYKERTVEGLWVSIPSLEIGRKLPKKENGYKIDSVTCRIIYDFDEKEAYASMGAQYKFDIKNRNDFEKRVDEIHTLSMDPTWEKISPVSDEEAGRPFYMYSGFPMIFTRENPKLGTVEYVDMDFAIDYWVKFTVYEKPQ